MDNRKDVVILLTAILFVSQLGYGLLIFAPMFAGQLQFVYAALLLVFGFWKYNNPSNKLSIIGNKYFACLCICLVMSVIMADTIWNQTFMQSVILYRHHVWLLFLPLILRMQPSVEEIKEAIFYFGVGYAIAWVTQATGLTPVNTSKEMVDGTTLEITTNEFGGYSVGGVRFICFSAYVFLGSLVSGYNKKDFYKSIFFLILCVLSAQRAIMFPALAIYLYAFVFKLKLSQSTKVLLVSLIAITSVVIVVNTLDIWNSLYEETMDQLGDKDYNRWKAIDYFTSDYSNSIFAFIFGNGFLTTHNAGGLLIQQLGMYGIYIDDIGMLGVWVRYGIIPIIIMYYIVLVSLLRKDTPPMLKYASIHLGFMPTAWALVGFHWFVFIFYIYLFLSYKTGYYD